MRGLLLLPFLLSAVPLFAQLPPGHQGPRFGLGLATQSVGGLFQNTQNLLVGPLLGWHFEAPLHEQVSLMPEVLWMTKGAVVRNTAQDVRTRTALHYIEVPVLVKVSTDRDADGLYLLIGPSLGYLVAGRYQMWQYGEQVTDTKYQLEDSQNRFQFSGAVGMGMEGPKWAFDVRAQTSLTPFDAMTNVQNVVYALTFAYRIEGKGVQKKEEEE